MSERRTPEVSIRLIGATGRRIKIEIYKAVLWKGKKDLPPRHQLEGRYRIRVNGRWFAPEPDVGRYQFMTIWEFRDKFFQALKNMIEPV